MASAGDHPPLFALDVAADDGRTTVSAAGELDLASADAFTAAVADGLAAGPVVVDLSALTFMDSSGVRALNTALREASQHGRELRVRGDMQPSVVQILELSGMMSLLPIEDGP